MLTVMPTKPMPTKGVRSFHLRVMPLFFRALKAKGSKIRPPMKKRLKVICNGLNTPETVFSAISMVENKTVAMAMNTYPFFIGSSLSRRFPPLLSYGRA